MKNTDNGGVVIGASDYFDTQYNETKQLTNKFLVNMHVKGDLILGGAVDRKTGIDHRALIIFDRGPQGITLIENWEMLKT